MFDLCKLEVYISKCVRCDLFICVFFLVCVNVLSNRKDVWYVVAVAGMSELARPSLSGYCILICIHLVILKLI